MNIQHLLKGLFFASFFSIFVPVTISCHNQDDDQKSISSEEFLKIAYDPGIVILDVRSEPEYRQGHMPNAFLMDYHDKNFKNKINILDKNPNYYVYCYSGSRSHNAVKIMNKLGFINAYNVTGGITEILKSGGTLVK